MYDVTAMAYDEELAKRIATILAPYDGLTERKMFGGIAFASSLPPK